MEEGMKRFSFTLSPALVDKVDEVGKGLGMNRSQIVREALSHWLHHNTSGFHIQDVNTVAVITYNYNHTDTRVIKDLMEIQHHYGYLITSTTHIHIDSTRCFEMSICSGKGSDIIKFGNTIRKIKGIDGFFTYFSR